MKAYGMYNGTVTEWKVFTGKLWLIIRLVYIIILYFYFYGILKTRSRDW